MTTLWADGFEDTAAADLSADYTAAGTWSITAGRRAGTSALRQTTTGTTIARALGSSSATIFQSIAAKPAAIGTNSRTVMRFVESGVVHVSLAINSAGQIAAYRGDATTLLGTTAATVFTAGVWTWFQVKVVIHDTTGSVEIRDASGGVLLNLTGQDTRNAGTSGVIDTVQLGYSATGGTSADWDDWHVWDASGSICNTWTNDTRVDSKLPDGAGDLAQFTPSAGSNYDCVNEANFNTSDHVTSATAGHQDLYTFDDLSHSPPSIFAVLRTAVAQKDDAGARSLKMLTKSGGTIYAGSAITLTQGSNVRVFDVQEADPATGAAWTPANFNAAQFGFENV